jgi:hypothetical protein
MKTCKCCGELKSLDFFYKATPTRYYGSCKSCVLQKKKQYKVANPEKIKAQKAADYQKHKESRLKISTEWQRKNKEKKNKINARYREGKAEQLYAYIKDYYAANPDKKAEQLASQRKYRQENKGIVSANRRKHQAAKIQRTPAWLSDFDKLKIKCLYQVAAMRTKESGQMWHVDHTIPLQGKLVSGLHVPSNLRVVTALENMQKNNAYPLN